MGGKLSYYVAIALSGGCLALAVVTVMTSRGNRAIQQELEARAREAQGKQAEIQARSQAIQTEMQTLANTEQIGRGILADMGSLAVSNEAMRALLAKHGYTLKASEGTNVPAAAVSTAEPAVPAVQKTAPKPVAEVVSEPVGVPDQAKDGGAKP